MDLKELREKQGFEIADARAIHDKAGEEKRAMTDEERGVWDAHMDAADGFEDQIKVAIRQQEADRRAAEIAGQEDRTKHDAEKKTSTLEERQMAGFGEFLANNRADCNPEIMQEFRGLQMDLDVKGGYMVVPELFIKELLRDVDDAHVVRQLARKFPLKKAASMGVPTVTAKPSSFTWGAELGPVAFDTSMRLGKRALNPHPATVGIKVSRDLMRISAIDTMSLVRMELAEEVGNGEGEGFLTGSGSNQPLGLFTASDDGISTSRDVDTGNSSTNVSFDNAIYVETALKAQYRRNAAWIMHRNVERNYRLLKDGEGQYIWQQSVVVGKPNTILGYPIHLDEDAPSTFSGSGYMSILGDYRFYWIADAYDMELQRLDEKYAETNEVGFIGRLKVDGAPVKEEAFVRSQLV